MCLFPLLQADWSQVLFLMSFYTSQHGSRSWCRVFVLVSLCCPIQTKLPQACSVESLYAQITAMHQRFLPYTDGMHQRLFHAWWSVGIWLETLFRPPFTLSIEPS